MHRQKLIMAIDSEPLGVINPQLDRLKHGSNFWVTYVTFSLSLMFFGAANGIVRWYGTPVRTKDTWLWRNLSVSAIHGFSVGVWSIVSLFLYHSEKPTIVEDPLFYFNTSSYLMMIVSMGYFLYDALDTLANSSLKKSKEILIHHAVIIFAFGYYWFKLIAIGYAHLCLLSEFSSFLLHARKLLRLYNVPLNTVYYTAFSCFNLVAFFVLRLIPLSFVVYRFYPEFFLMRVPFSVYLTLCSFGLVIYLINVGFFFKLVQSDVIRRYSNKSS